MANSLLDDTYDRFVTGLAEGRGLTREAVEAAIDSGTIRNQQLEAVGLIDGELHLDEVIDRFGKQVVEHAEYASVEPEDLGFEAQAEFALIYGTGPVVQGKAARSPLSDPGAFASETISRAILDAADDPTISAILFRIDSPGGSALASELIWRAVERAQAAGKPVIASFSDVAASGGYYVASGVDGIVADPGTLTGSIGVYALRPVLGGLLAKLGVGIDSLTRGRHADFLLSSKKMSPATLARLQTTVLDTYQIFLSRVSDGRSMAMAEVDRVGQGRVWTGRQAYELVLLTNSVDFIPPRVARSGPSVSTRTPTSISFRIRGRLHSRSRFFRSFKRAHWESGDPPSTGRNPSESSSRWRVRCQWEVHC
jgi:protease-4